MPNSHGTTGAVFLSYAREDGEAARRIADALRGFGVEVWFDMNELRGGDAWDAKIRRQIRECALFIPIVSANTQSRGEGYFRREWKQAVDRTHDMSEHRAFIVPVITDATPEASADVPEQFLKAQFTRLAGGAPTAQFVENIKRLIQAPQPQATHVSTVPSPGLASAQSGGASGPDSRSIAVLPFLNRSPDADQEYFVDGLSEELLNLLAKVPALKVTSRSSAFSYKGTNARVTQVAKELNVANILEGSVRKSGNRLRISVQLIDARTDQHLWSESFDRTIDDIFAVQDEIAGAVVDQLKVTLLGAAPRKYSYNPEAYALYLQARELSRRDTQECYAQAQSMFENALELDPSLAPAWVQMALGFFNQTSNGFRSIAEGTVLIRHATEKALAIDPNLAGAHSILGMQAQLLEQDSAAAARHFERALSLEPTNTEILSQTIYLARGLGKLELSVRIAEHTARQDPVNPTGHARLCGCYMRVGRYDDSIASGRAALRLSPGRSQTHYAICLSLLMKGDPAAALAEVQLEPAETWRFEGLAMVHHVLGHREKSDDALNELIRKWKGDAAWNIACVCAFRGETDLAFEWLEKAVLSKDSGLIDTAWTRQFESIHGDPRWLPFLRKIGKAPEQLAAIQFEVNLPK